MDVDEHNFNAALHQKRLLAFINHFLVRNIQFLNNFAQQCEQKLMGFESKMNNIEASLTILESQLKSIPDETIAIKATANKPVENIDETNEKVVPETLETTPVDAALARDPVYERFFKMIHVGVPIQAVKLKVIQEGLDPRVIEQG